MSDAQKYQKKKNLLIVLLLALLVVFVIIMCGIIIYAKQHPPMKFLDPEDIEIKQMQVIDYNALEFVNYSEVTESNTFRVVEEGQEYLLVLTDNQEVKMLKEEQEQPIEILKNDENINSNIKLIYQTTRESLILTVNGELYKLADNNIVDGKIKVGEILTDTKVRNIVMFSTQTGNTYIIDEENKIVNIDTLEEYKGVVNEIKTDTSTIYLYENNYFGLEEGKIVVNEYNEPLRVKISFDNKIIEESDVIYEINPVDNTVSTSNLGSFSKIWYKLNEDTNIYDVTLMSSTGYKDFTSTYYHQ